MSKSVLNKEFKEKDVNRLRNLIQGKHGDKSSIGVGYTKPHIEHNEGDEWEEDGRSWKIQNGVKQNITRLDGAKKGITLPLFCPKCSNKMKVSLDKKWFIIYDHCFNCQIDYEANLKKEGIFEKVESDINNSIINDMSKDFEIWIDELINTNETFVAENGDVEEWIGDGKKQLLKYKQETLKYFNNYKK